MTIMSGTEKLETMEKKMRVSWDEIDQYFRNEIGGRIDSRSSFGLIWAVNKWPLYKKFGDKLFLSQEVENTLSDKDIRDTYKEKVLKKIYEEVSLKGSLVASFFLTAFSLEELTSNRVTETKELSGKKITKGMKISKSLKLFIQDKKELDIIQTAFSRFVQELEAKGILEISVDFFDILCMSVNPQGRWRSCHNFINGEYGGGAFAYALDESSAIAQIFLGGEDKEVVRNKIWRQMIWFDTKQESAILSRQYPMANNNNRNSTVHLLENELGSSDFRYGYNETENLRYFFSNLGDYHYNDVTYEACNKVSMVVFDDKDHVFKGENGSHNIIREAIEQEKYNPEYVVGVEELYSPYSGEYYDAEDWAECWRGEVWYNETN